MHHGNVTDLVNPHDRDREPDVVPAPDDERDDTDPDADVEKVVVPPLHLPLETPEADAIDQHREVPLDDEER